MPKKEAETPQYEGTLYPFSFPNRDAGRPITIMAATREEAEAKNQAFLETTETEQEAS